MNLIHIFVVAVPSLSDIFIACDVASGQLKCLHAGEEEKSKAHYSAENHYSLGGRIQKFLVAIWVLRAWRWHSLDE